MRPRTRQIRTVASLTGFGWAAPGSVKGPAPGKVFLLVAREWAMTENAVNRSCLACLLVLPVLYARPSVRLVVKKSDCLPPRPSLSVPARFWANIVAFSAGTATAEALMQDDTVLLGSVKADRLWWKDVLKVLACCEWKGKVLRQIALLSEAQLRDVVTAEAWLKDHPPRIRSEVGHGMGLGSALEYVGEPPAFILVGKSLCAFIVVGKSL